MEEQDRLAHSLVDVVDTAHTAVEPARLEREEPRVRCEWWDVRHEQREGGEGHRLSWPNDAQTQTMMKEGCFSAGSSTSKYVWVQVCARGILRVSHAVDVIAWRSP